MPELPPVYLCVPESLQATSLDTQERFSPSAHWTAGGPGRLPGPAFPSVRDVSECAGLNLPFPSASGSLPASSWWQPHSHEGLSTAVFTCAFPTLSRFPVVQVGCYPQALVAAATCTPGPGLRLQKQIEE